MKKLISLCLLIVFVFNGCVTKSVWKPEETIEKKEVIKQFLVSENKKTIVFLGENYHFIFGSDNMNDRDYKFMIKLLNLSKQDRKLLRIDELHTKIHIENNGEMKCFTVIKIDSKELNKEKIYFFRKLGFYYSKRKNVLRAHLNLNGKVYKTNEKFNKYVKGLSKEYNLKLLVKKDKENGYSTLEKIALTPLTLTGDILLTATGIGVGLMGVSAGEARGIDMIAKTIEIQLKSFDELTDIWTDK